MAGTGVCVSAVEGDSPQFAPRLVITCRRCGQEETMNDEDGSCALPDLVTWAAGHECQAAR